MNFLTNYCHHPTKVSTLNLSLSFLTQHISDRIVASPSLTFLHILLLLFGLLGEKTFWVDFVLLMPTLADEAHPSQVSFFPVIMMAQGNERETRERESIDLA